MGKSLQRKVRKLDLNKALGHCLSDLRHQANMRQSDVGDALRLDRALISKIENGHRALDATELPDYARALGIEPEELFGLVMDIVVEYDGRLPEERHDRQ